MKALVWHGMNDIRVESIEEPTVGKNNVKVKVAWTGICGSDLHAYKFGANMQVNEPHPMTGQKAPIVLGHEFSGVVSEVGENITDIKVGDRVVIEPIFVCLSCAYCRSGKYNYCESTAWIGFNANGAFAEYVIVEPYMVHKLPEKVTLEEGALVEPAAVALHAVKSSKLKVGDTVTVFGVGPIGLLTVMAAKAAGAAKVIAIDLSEERLKKAKEVGATDIINSSEIDPTKYILSKYGPVDVSFDAAGAQATFDSAAQVIKKGGQIKIIAAFTHTVGVDFATLLLKEVEIATTLAYRHNFKHVLELIESGKMDVKKIITSKISLDHVIEEGFERLLEDKSQAKILVEV